MNSLTLAQRSNFLPLTAWGYGWWRTRSLTLLSGQPFSLAREEALFLALCRPQPEQVWLDMGTSAGFYAGVLAAAGCRVDALDLSSAMLRKAARRNPSRLIRWQRVNAEETGFADASYDGVTIGATLNETADPARLLREAARVLRPGGKLWLMYAARTGSPAQRALGRLDGLNFPEVTWVERQVPGLSLTHAARFGAVEFALLQKENHAPPKV